MSHIRKVRDTSRGKGIKTSRPHDVFLTQGLTSEEMDVYIREATNDPARQLWLEQHLFPFGAPYHSKDGTLILPMATFNRFLRKLLM